MDEIDELRRKLFAKYAGTATEQTVTNGNTVATVASVAVAKADNTHEKQSDEKPEQKPDERTRRLNNMIAEFMEYDGATEKEAMILARYIIDNCGIALGEAKYKEAPIKYAYADCPVSDEHTISQIVNELTK